jgi:hypothetical protein
MLWALLALIVPADVLFLSITSAFRLPYLGRYSGCRLRPRGAQAPDQIPCAARSFKSVGAVASHGRYDGIKIFRTNRASYGFAHRVSGVWRSWALPVILGLGFIALLPDANPVLCGWGASLSNVGFDVDAVLGRMMFWTIIAWPT